MAGLYSHTTRASGLTLTANIYNSDHQNHIDNHDPEQMDDYSPDVATMKSTTDPGETGTENQPTNLSGEIERLRYAILDAKGTTFWYETPSVNLSELTANTANPGENEIIRQRVFS